MGLFSSKRPEPVDDDELPKSSIPVVQTVIPNSATNPSGRPQDVRVTAANPASPPTATIARRPPDPFAPAVTAAVAAPVPPVPHPSPRFGIEDAVRLLRELPGKDSHSVREAVQRTLTFMNVDLESLVEDANNKDSQLDSRAQNLQREVEQHEALALAAKKQIAAIQSERTELDAARTWVVEHRRIQSTQHAQHAPQEPVPLDRPLDRVVRGTPFHGQGNNG